MVMEESQTRTEQKGGEQFQTHDDNGLFPLTLSCDARVRAAYMYTWKEKCDTVSIDGNTQSLLCQLHQVNQRQSKPTPATKSEAAVYHHHTRTVPPWYTPP